MLFSDLAKHILKAIKHTFFSITLFLLNAKQSFSNLQLFPHWNFPRNPFRNFSTPNRKWWQMKKRFSYLIQNCLCETEQSSFNEGGWSRGWLIILCAMKKNFFFWHSGGNFFKTSSSHTSRINRFSNTEFSDIGHNFLHINRINFTHKIFRKTVSLFLLSFGCFVEFPHFH